MTDIIWPCFLSFIILGIWPGLCFFAGRYWERRGLRLRSFIGRRDELDV
jgi:hypothetical protein